MNEVQKRILDTLHNIGGNATVNDIQQRGNIAKSTLVIEYNLTEMQREKVVKQIGRMWIPVNNHIPVNRPKRKVTHGGAHRPVGETRGMVRKLREENPDMLITEIAKQLGIKDPTVHHHLQKIREEDALIDPTLEKGVQEIEKRLGISTVGELDDRVEQEAKENCVVLDAVERLKIKLAEEPKLICLHEVKDFQIKYDMLTGLAELMEESIRVELHAVREDLAYLHSLSVSVPKDS